MRLTTLVVMSAATRSPPQSAARILVIDDEVQIRRFLRISLVSQGYEVIEAGTGGEGLELAATRAPDLVVLDLGLPAMDGKQVLAELRGWSSVPVVILSVRADEGEKVKALDEGANDYVVKPFGMQEFLARVRGLLRERLADGATAGVYDDAFLRIDLGRRLVTVAGANSRLTRREFDVLKMLFAHCDMVVTQTQLLREIWRPSHERDTHYLRIIIGRLRQKLHDDPTEPRYLLTEPGVGYRFSTENRD